MTHEASFRELKALSDLIEKFSQTASGASEKELVIQFKTAELELKQAIFRNEKQHSEAVDNLKMRHSQAMADVKRKHAEEVAKLKAENEQLESQLAAQDDKPTLTSCEKTGTWIEESTGIHYCPVCRSKSPPIFQPMRNDPYEWTCTVCNNRYPDPDRPPPAPIAINKPQRYLRRPGER